MSKFGIGKVAKDLEKIKDQIATDLILTSHAFFIKQFDSEKWVGEKWEPVKRNEYGSKSKYKGLPILVNTGTLRSSLLAPFFGKKWNSCYLEINNTYADYHNKGGRLPKRQFVGHDSTILEKTQIKIIESHLDRLFL